MRIVLSPELTEEETFFIGKIMAQWGAIEYEIFAQTLGTFEGHTLDQLPKEVNNLQFSGMLRLWRERVAEKAGGERGAVLLRQADALVALQDYRNALIHGMWEWGTNGTPHDLSVIRIAKHQIKKTSFPAGVARRVKLSHLAQGKSEPLFRTVCLFRAKADDAFEGTVDADPCAQGPRAVAARDRATAGRLSQYRNSLLGCR
ncbi:hypothetical protein [Cupriavidus sp. H19C3]|uniref:hypothetical protein n=1 Tax=Cupriavidus sp. H19C3 TaxID=3241603 RepID=UPI003BF77463